MAALSENCSTSIVAPISYIANLPRYDEEVPYYLLEVEPTPDVPSTNIELITKDVLIKDMRTHSEEMAVEANGFQLFDWPQSKIHVGSDFDEVERYCKEMAKLVAKEVEAEKVFVFDFRFRLNDLATSRSKVPSKLKHQGGPAQSFFAEPVHKAHLDQTQEGGLRRLRLHLTEEEFLKYSSDNYRVRIMNIWRSFNDTTQDVPLAFCNPRSIWKDDPMVVEIVEPNRIGQNYYLRYNEKHEWFWASDMIPSEVMVFTTWDSKRTEQVTNCAYHTAFPHPSEQTTPRVSLEVRTIVVNALV